MRSIAYLVSVYFWFAVIATAMSVLNTKTEKVEMPERKCSTNKIFDENYDPDYFYHITDVHISHISNDTVDNYKKALEIGSKFKPDFLLNTGDMVDSYYFPYKFKGVRISQQVPEEWKLYSSATSQYSSNFGSIIECAGNHDIPRIWSLKSKEFSYGHYSEVSKHANITYSTDEFQFIVKQIGNFTHIILNPLTFPLAPVPFNYYARPSREFLDRLEREIDNANNSTTVIVSSHFHGPVWSNEKSSNDLSFKDIINKEKVAMFISGHNHGKDHMIMHHGNALEICGSDLRYNKKAGFVTNDNNMPVYHYIDINTPQDFFVTFPVPIEQTTSRTICDGESLNIRVVAFNDTASLFATIDNGLPQKLEKIRQLKNNSYLYGISISELSAGKHTLNVKSSTSSEEIVFLYGNNQKVEKGTELNYDDMLWSKYHIYVYFVLFALALFITLPVNILLFDNFNEWIVDSAFQKNQVLMWTMTFLAGFLSIRSRIAKLQLPVRILLFISTLISCVVPYFTYHVEGHICHAFIFGTLMDGKVKYEPWCTFIVFYFLIVSVYPPIFAMSSFGLSRRAKYSWVQIIDIIVFVGAIAGNLVISMIVFSLIDGKIDGLMSGFVTYIGGWLLFIIGYFIYDFIERKRDFTYLDARLEALVDSTDDQMA